MEYIDVIVNNEQPVKVTKEEAIKLIRNEDVIINSLSMDYGDRELGDFLSHTVNDYLTDKEQGEVPHGSRIILEPVSICQKPSKIGSGVDVDCYWNCINKDGDMVFELEFNAENITGPYIDRGCDFTLIYQTLWQLKLSGAAATPEDEEALFRACKFIAE